MKGNDAEVMTINEFCALMRISRTTYWRRRKEGKGPQEMKFGATVRISKDSAEKWKRDCLR